MKKKKLFLNRINDFISLTPTTDKLPLIIGMILGNNKAEFRWPCNSFSKRDMWAQWKYPQPLHIGTADTNTLTDKGLSCTIPAPPLLVSVACQSLFICDFYVFGNQHNLFMTYWNHFQPQSRTTARSGIISSSPSPPHSFFGWKKTVKKDYPAS